MLQYGKWLPPFVNVCLTIMGDALPKDEDRDSDVMSLKAELVAAGMDGQRIWYDKDNDPSVEQMRLGVRANRCFLLFLTEDVLCRPFCRPSRARVAECIDGLSSDDSHGVRRRPRDMAIGGWAGPAHLG